MNREFPRDPGRPRRVNRPHWITRVSRQGISFDFDFWWTTVCVLIILAVALFAITDVWPYMHEVILQQSWKPVCDYGHGYLEFCRRP